MLLCLLYRTKNKHSNDDHYIILKDWIGLYEPHINSYLEPPQEVKLGSIQDIVTLVCVAWLLVCAL
jgi:hypothetical protein